MGNKRKTMTATERDLSQEIRKGNQRDPIHGNLYQLQLLMLFLYGGIKHEYTFCLRSEVEEAKKFDDIVFEYTQDNGKVFRLLQAKHRKKQTKKIVTDNLITESDGDFSLTKYFFSYQELKTEQTFQGGTIKDVTIFTNIDFDVDDLKRERVSIEKIKEEDEILDLNCRGNPKESVRYKFCEKVISLLKPRLENYHITKLATKLADCILENKPIQHHIKDDIFSKYHQVLAEDVINIKSNNFHDNFINDVNTSTTVKRFRGIFENELKKKTNGKLSLKNLNEEIDNKSILKTEIGLKLAKKFGKGDDSTQVWEQWQFSDSDINEFLNHLVFAVNQPNEEELGNILKYKIGSGYNYITAKNLYKKLFHKMLKLLQGKGKNSFLTHAEGKALFEVGIKEIFFNSLYQYENQLRYTTFERNIKFRKRDDFQNFISSEQFLWILHSETPWLTSLAVYQELITSNQYLKYLFVNESALQGKHNTFNDFKKIELWIIICLSTEGADNKTIPNIIDSFQESIDGSEQTNKRLIYITPNRYNLEKTSTSNNLYYREGLRISFGDLTGESQILITKEEVIRFQGNVKMQSIEELLQFDAQLLQKKMGELNLDSHDLEILLRNPQVDVWKERPRFSDLESVHYKPHMKLELHEMRKAIQTNVNDIFTFVGDENQMKKIFQSEISLHRFREIRSTFPAIIHRFILLDLQKSIEQYKELCHMIDEPNTKAIHGVNLPTLHLLQCHENEWIWEQSYNKNIYIQRHFHTDFEKKFLRDLVHEIHHDSCVIISGYNRKTLAKNLKISEAFLERKKNLFISQCHKEAEHFFKLYKKNWSLGSFKFVSWHKVNTGDHPYAENFYFQRSEGNGTEVHKRIIVLNRNLTEKDLKTSKRKVIVLTGEAGIGKSLTLTHIAEAGKNSMPSYLVIKVELKKFEKIIAPTSCSMLSDVIDLLSLYFNDTKNSLTKKIFTYMLRYTNRVKIFWDGFNDVSPDKQADVLKLLKLLHGESFASMWITTRRDDQEKLEKELPVSVYNFSLGNDNFQDSILTQYLDTALKFSSQFAGQFNTTLKKQITHCLDSKFGNKENIMRMPLIMHTAVEMQLEKIGCTADNDKSINYSILENNLLITDVYSSFIDKMYNIYIYEKSGIPTDNNLNMDSIPSLKKMYTKHYGHLALRVICEDFNFTIDCIQKKSERLLNTLLKIGLVEKHGESPNFIHQSFVEYFATELITSKLECKPVTNPACKKLWDVLLNKILMYYYGRRFFESKLLTHHAIGNLLTDSEQKDIVCTIILEKSSNIVFVFWLAALDGLERTLKLLLKSTKNMDSLKKISNIVLNVELFSTYAPYSLLVKTIMNYGKDLDATEVDKLIDANETNFLYRAVREDDLEGFGIVKKLCAKYRDDCTVNYIKRLSS